MAVNHAWDAVKPRTESDPLRPWDRTYDRAHDPSISDPPDMEEIMAKLARDLAARKPWPRWRYVR